MNPQKLPLLFFSTTFLSLGLCLAQLSALGYDGKKTDLLPHKLLVLQPVTVADQVVNNPILRDNYPVDLNCINEMCGDTLLLPAHNHSFEANTLPKKPAQTDNITAEIQKACQFIDGRFFVNGAPVTDQEAELLYNINIKEYRKNDIYRSDIFGNNTSIHPDIIPQISLNSLSPNLSNLIIGNPANNLVAYNNTPHIYPTSAADIAPSNPNSIVVPAISVTGKIVMADLYNEDIPAYQHYDYIWDTKDIHPYHYDLSKMPNAVEFVFTNGIDLDFVMPCEGNTTSEFGPRWGRHHNGIDLDLDSGDDVFAAFAGRVRVAQYSPSYGYIVVIRHFNGLETFYAHLSRPLVVPDQNVQAGDIIGYGGSTGRSTGSHLHFEMRYKGHPFNPRQFIDFTQNKLKSHTFTIDQSFFTSTDPYNHQADDVKNKTATKKASPRKIERHTVKNGETLSEIAKKYGISLRQLCRYNDISAKKVIKPGEKIRVK